MKLLIAGGGTGGHVFPAIAVAREWKARKKDREVVLVGTERGIEMKLAPLAGLPLETIRAAGLKGMGGTRLLKNAAMLLPAMMDSAAILRRHRCAAAFGVGGYASGPMMLAAALRRVPMVIFEPNAEPGLANRMLARLADRIATAHRSTAEQWGAKAVVTGCPIRKEFFNVPAREHRAPFHILITGGSQGANAVNRAVAQAAGKFAERKGELRFVHQSGERDYNEVREAYAQQGLHAEVVPFIQNMAERFAQADLIVCRSGAITVAEISAAGKAAILVPFAGATDAHQLRNAEVMQQAGAARLLPQAELTPKRLAAEIFSLLDQPEQLTRMEQAARGHSHPHAAEEIVNLIEGVARA